MGEAEMGVPRRAHLPDNAGTDDGQYATTQGDHMMIEIITHTVLSQLFAGRVITPELPS